MAFKILVIDDEEIVGLSISRSLAKEGYQTSLVKTGEEALERLAQEDFHLIFLDLFLPGISGLPLLARIKKEFPDVLVVVLTAYENVQVAVQAMKMGAFDYLTKSSDMEELKLLVKKAMETKKLHREVRVLRAEIDRHYHTFTLEGNSLQIQNVRYLIKKVSKVDQCTVLVIGESGTGKELVARTIHRESARAGNPFIDISCSALPNSLIETELFGFEKGAFTDAKNRKLGLIELADGGTLFLDEIGTLDLSMQAKLLRVLEQRIFRRIGGVKDVSVNISVIAATNDDLSKMVEHGTFRHDLYYRLNVFLIRLPPLRERKEDIPILVHKFIQKFKEDFHKNIQGIHPEAQKMLMEYDYPGNVRELKNFIERAMIMEDGDLITIDSLDFFKTPRVNSSILYQKDQDNRSKEDENNLEDLTATKLNLRELEKRHIMEILKKTEGNKAKAAILLGIARSTLFKKIKEYQLL